MHRTPRRDIRLFVRLATAFFLTLLPGVAVADPTVNWTGTCGPNFPISIQNNSESVYWHQFAGRCVSSVSEALEVIVASDGDTVDPQVWVGAGTDSGQVGSTVQFQLYISGMPYAPGYYNFTRNFASQPFKQLGASYAYTPNPAAPGNTPDSGSQAPDAPSDGGVAEPGSICVCDPIDVGTGNVFEQVTDYATAGPNKLSFTRYYNSLGNENTVAASLGVNWRSTYDRYLNVVMVDGQPTQVTAERANGATIVFTAQGGAWVTDTDVDLKLTLSGTVWTLTDSDDTVETYSAPPSLMLEAFGYSTISVPNTLVVSTITARNGYTQTMQYNASNQLVAVVDSYGRQLNFTYQSGLLQTLSTPDYAITYGYNASGFSPSNDRLASVTYPTAPATSQTYLYGSFPQVFDMTGIVDENGEHFATWTYDQSNRGTSNQRAGGADLTTIAYNDIDGSRTVTNAFGVTDLYTFATLQGVPKVTGISRQATSTTAAASRSFTYDANGYLASATDWNGNQINYVNDARGEPTSIVEAAGTTVARTTAITYHPTFHLPTEVVTQGLTVDYTYDGTGELLTETETDTTAAAEAEASRLWSYKWTNALPASVTDPRGSVTSFAHDGSGALTATTNALGQTTQVTAHLAGGLPLTTVDPNGVVTRLTYTARQWTHSKTVVTSAGDRITSYDHDPAGNLTRVTLPGGAALNSAYDDAHRLIRTTDLLGQRISYELDALGDQTKIAMFVKGDDRAAGRRTATYDALGRVIEDVTGGIDEATRYTYDPNGNPLTVADPLHRTTTRQFDALNRPVQTTDPAGGITTYTYDAHDRPTSVTDPNTNATRYIYDGFGDVVERVSPDSGTTNYQYDPAGNLIQKTDAGGVVTQYGYDALNRPTAVTYPSDPAENVTYVYDEAGHGFGIGRLTSITDAAGSLGRTYDELGNVLSETRSFGAATFITSDTYDLASRVASVTYPSGLVVTYMRDAMGQIAGIEAQAPGGAAVSVASNIAYQPFGPLKALTFGNGIVEQRDYDLGYRQTAVSDLGAAAVQNLAYHYDLAGNLRTATDGVTPGNNQSFIYNSLDRLTEAKGAYGKLGYRYDPVGNRTKTFAGSAMLNTAYSYTPLSNQLATVTMGGATQNLAYTPTGNLSSVNVSGNVTSYTYNAANRVASVSMLGQNVAGYTYDAFGHRFALAPSGPSGPKTLFLYDRADNLLEEAGDNGTSNRDYVYLGGQPVAFVLPQSGTLYFVHTDRLGTPQAVTDSTQTVAWHAAYKPFGEISIGTTNIAQNLRLPGQYEDTSLGWYQNGFRDYVPAWGRYLESDPLGLGGGLNTYAYALGNPGKYTDPKGLSGDCPPDDDMQTDDEIDVDAIADDFGIAVDDLNFFRWIAGGDDINIPGLNYYGTAAAANAFAQAPTLRNGVELTANLSSYSDWTKGFGLGVSLGKTLTYGSYLLSVHTWGQEKVDEFLITTGHRLRI